MLAFCSSTLKKVEEKRKIQHRKLIKVKKKMALAVISKPKQIYKLDFYTLIITV